MGSDRYVQRLPALDLSIEANSDDVPADGWFYLIRSGQQVGRFKSLKAAQKAWGELIEDSGWEPPKRDVDPHDLLVREAAMREAERFKEYWGNSHKFRVRGGVHRNR